MKNNIFSSFPSGPWTALPGCEVHCDWTLLPESILPRVQQQRRIYFIRRPSCNVTSLVYTVSFDYVSSTCIFHPSDAAERDVRTLPWEKTLSATVTLPSICWVWGEGRHFFQMRAGSWWIGAGERTASLIGSWWRAESGVWSNGGVITAASLLQPSHSNILSLFSFPQLKDLSGSVSRCCWCLSQKSLHILTHHTFLSFLSTLPHSPSVPFSLSLSLFAAAASASQCQGWRVFT